MACVNRMTAVPLQITECAPLYFVVGDAGNEEGPETITAASETVRHTVGPTCYAPPSAGPRLCVCAQVLPAALGFQF